MNVLIMSLIDIQTVSSYSLYPDLLRRFIAHGDRVYIISPFERRNSERERVIEEVNARIVKVKIWNMQKTNGIEKLFSMITIDKIFIKAIQKYFGDVRFDLILYPTPPITFGNAVEYVKNRDGAKTYLLLKDIFPQNAVDLGMMTKNGIKGVLYKYFRCQEKKLYAISDRIGCMSPANVEYILQHNPEIDPRKVEVCPNSIEIIDKSVDDEVRKAIRNKYNIPLDKKVFVYGGNLGKPQGIDFLIRCLKKCENSAAFFLIVGDGTEYRLLENYVINSRPKNVKLMPRIPKEDYDNMVGACDVGMIFLDHRFTIPNFPSRILSYMQAKLPVLAVTDRNTDIGKIITDNGFGWWCESVDEELFGNLIKKIIKSNFNHMKKRSFDFLKENYYAENSYRIINA